VPREIIAHPLAGDVPPQTLAGATVVVIDVLRAATTMIHALAAGAVEILPCQRVDAARRLAAGFAPGSALLGGERLGLPIPGFDLGNSPSEYTRERVAGRSVVFTSTNGTRALARSRRAERAFLAAFVNLSAVARAVSGAERLHLLCAGTRGRLSEEDLLLAGALADCLETRALDAEARAALTRWRELGVDRLNRAEPQPALLAALRESRGGRNVVANGFEPDIRTAACIDRFHLVPHLDPRSFRIRPLEKVGLRSNQPAS
jgi:2-phosphosulfolactate phosphatase